MWSSQLISLSHGVTVQVRASSDGVVHGKNVDGVDASDTLYTPEQAIELAEALTEAATRCLAARGQA